MRDTIGPSAGEGPGSVLAAARLRIGGKISPGRIEPETQAKILDPIPAISIHGGPGSGHNGTYLRSSSPRKRGSFDD